MRRHTQAPELIGELTSVRILTLRVIALDTGGRRKAKAKQALSA